MVMQMKGRGLLTLMQFVRIKQLRHNKYAVAHAQCFRPKVKADNRKFKAMKESFDTATGMYMAIHSCEYTHCVGYCATTGL